MGGTVDEAHEFVSCIDACAVDEDDISQQALMSSNNSSRSISVRVKERSGSWV